MNIFAHFTLTPHLCLERLCYLNKNYCFSYSEPTHYWCNSWTTFRNVIWLERFYMYNVLMPFAHFVNLLFGEWQKIKGIFWVDRMWAFWHIFLSSNTRHTLKKNKMLLIYLYGKSPCYRIIRTKLSLLQIFLSLWELLKSFRNCKFYFISILFIASQHCVS